MAAKSQTKERTDSRLKEPRRYKVITYNDDFTTMEFVVDILVEIFKKSYDEAMDIMMTIHKGSRAVVGIYSLDIAKTRAARAVTLARNEGFPLRVEVEPE